MHITKLYVSGFKSLVDFHLDLAPFTCLIGLNGCGKSTVLQCFDFLAHLLGGDIDEWFKRREWAADDVRSLPGAHNSIVFKVEFSDDSHWEGRYEIASRQCIEEHVQSPTASMNLENGKVTGFAPGSEFPDSEPKDSTRSVVDLVYKGSITSLYRDEALPNSIRNLRQFFQRLHAFDTLSPQFLRRRDREIRESIGHSGEHLSTFFAELSDKSRESVVNDLVDLYPQLENMFVQPLQGGWKELMLHESYDDQKMIIPSKHVNDGLLRLLAILTEFQSAHSFLLFDEIENGINPELVEILIQKLTHSSHQVLVTTHSPMILNYLDDVTARESVVFLYKGEDGRTRSTRFFEIPALSDKLDVMGPGEAFVDTNLVALAKLLGSAAGVE